MALEFEAVAVGVAGEKAVQAFDFVGIPGYGESASFDRFGRGADVADPECEVPARLRLNVAAGDQVKIDGADAIPGAGEVEAFWGGGLPLVSARRHKTRGRGACRSR